MTEVWSPVFVLCCSVLDASSRQGRAATSTERAVMGGLYRYRNDTNKLRHHMLCTCVGRDGQGFGACPKCIFGSAPRAFPMVFWRAWPCVSPMTMSRTAHSPWSPRPVALGALLGSSRAWFGSASCCPGWLRVKLCRFGPLLSKRVLLLSPRFCLWSSSERAKPEASFFVSFSHPS